MVPQLKSELTNPYAGRDMPSLLADRAGQYGDKPFLIWEPFDGAARTWSYAQFADDVASLAAGLVAAGVKQGDPVLIHLDNCPEAQLAWHACARLGAIAVTTNTKSAAAEMDYFVSHSKPVLAITQPKYADMLGDVVGAEKPLFVTAKDGDDASDELPAPSVGRLFSTLITDSSDGLPDLAPDPWRPLSVQYTSGTTSRPKGVLWTHGNALWGGDVSAAHEGLTSEDVHFVHLPLFHTNALVYSSLATLWAGGTMVLAPRFSASRFWEVSVQHNCTWASMIPFCIKALLGQPVPDNHAYRCWGTAVAMPLAELHFKVKTLGWWGMTETVCHGTVSSLTEDEPVLSIGRCSKHYEIAIVNDGAPVKPGETGDLLVRGIPGLSLFAGYLHNDEATQDAFTDDGYMITGDRVMLAEDGLLYFADRAKDVLKVGGENVAASEVERVVAMVPGVNEAAVVAKPDDMMNEVPVAFVTLLPGQDAAAIGDAIMTLCAEQLAPFKCPREVIVIDEMPRATLEKIAKNELRKRFEGAEGDAGNSAGLLG